MFCQIFDRHQDHTFQHDNVPILPEPSGTFSSSTTSKLTVLHPNTSHCVFASDWNTRKIFYRLERLCLHIMVSTSIPSHLCAHLHIQVLISIETTLNLLFSINANRIVTLQIYIHRKLGNMKSEIKYWTCCVLNTTPKKKLEKRYC